MQSNVWVTITGQPSQCACLPLQLVSLPAAGLLRPSFRSAQSPIAATLPHMPAGRLLQRRYAQSATSPLLSVLPRAAQTPRGCASAAAAAACATAARPAAARTGGHTGPSAAACGHRVGQLPRSLLAADAARSSCNDRRHCGSGSGQAAAVTLESSLCQWPTPPSSWPRCGHAHEFFASSPDRSCCTCHPCCFVSCGSASM